MVWSIYNYIDKHYICAMVLQSQVENSSLEIFITLSLCLLSSACSCSHFSAHCFTASQNSPLVSFLSVRTDSSNAPDCKNNSTRYQTKWIHDFLFCVGTRFSWIVEKKHFTYLSIEYILKFSLCKQVQALILHVWCTWKGISDQ